MRKLKMIRMTKSIQTKLKKFNNQTNIDKYRVAANISEYHSKSKLILLRITITNFMMMRQLFHVKMYVKIYKIDVQTFWSRI